MLIKELLNTLKILIGNFIYYKIPKMYDKFFFSNSLFSVFIETIFFLFEYQIFLLTGKRSERMYLRYSKINDFSDNHISEAISKLISLFRGRYKINNPNGILKNVINNKENLNKVIYNLNKNGYYLFEEKVSQEICVRIREYALSRPCKIGRVESINYMFI